MTRRPVILDHDGGVDDLAALALLLAANAAKRPSVPEGTVFDLIGIVVVDADCFAVPAADCCDRLVAMVDPQRPSCPIAISSLGPQAVPFPDEWRKDCVNMLDLPCLNTADIDERIKARTRRVDTKGEELLAELVMASSEPVTIVVTGPLSNVAWCVSKHGAAFTDNVHSVVIMGGAVEVEGNVFLDNRDGSAEWNLFWDAPAAAAVVEAPGLQGKLVLFALDATNSVPVTSEFVRGFAKVTSPGTGRPTPLADFLGASWAMCTHFATLFGDAKGYYAWDALTAAFLLDPAVCRLEERHIRIDAVSGSPSEGRSEPVAASRGEKWTGVVGVALDINAGAFYDLCYAAARGV